MVGRDAHLVSILLLCSLGCSKWNNLLFFMSFIHAYSYEIVHLFFLILFIMYQRIFFISFCMSTLLDTCIIGSIYEYFCSFWKNYVILFSIIELGSLTFLNSNTIVEQPAYICFVTHLSSVQPYSVGRYLFTHNRDSSRT